MLTMKLAQCLAPHPPREERGDPGSAVIDVDRQPKRVADPLLQRDRIGILQLAAARLLRLALGHALDMRQRLRLPNIETFLDDTLGGGRRVGHADQRAGVAGRQLAQRDVGLHLGRQFRQPHHVGDVAAALADDLGNLVLAAFEFVGERVIALRLFHTVEVFALHVFDDRDLERVAVADIDRHDRHLVQADDLRRAPAALAGDDLETVLRALDRTHHDRLDHPVLPDRVGEFAEFGIGKIPARIARIGLEEFNRHLALGARPILMLGFAADISDQTCKTAAQSRTRIVGHRQLPWIQFECSGLDASVSQPSFEARGAAPRTSG